MVLTLAPLTPGARTEPSLQEPFVLSSICRGVAACDYVANVSFKSNNVRGTAGAAVATTCAFL